MSPVYLFIQIQILIGFQPNTGRISTTKRVLTGFSTKIKIKKNNERIKNISELKCNIELEIRFKT
jgi:hypothetical protein